MLGALLVVALFATSSSVGVTGALSHLSFGNMHAEPTSTETVYGGLGQLTVDTSHMRPGDTLQVQSVVGQTRVNLAPGQSAVVQGKVLAGQICIAGRSYASGIGAGSPAVQLPLTGHNQTAPSTGDPVAIFVHQLAGQVVIGTVGSDGCYSS
jgi:hypothetical protein